MNQFEMSLRVWNVWLLAPVVQSLDIVLSQGQILAKPFKQLGRGGTDSQIFTEENLCAELP